MSNALDTNAWLSPEQIQALGKVGVLYGGFSAERTVSLATGSAIYNALIDAGIDAELYDVDRQFLSLLIDKPFDFAFIALHGRGGEDGTLQAILDWLEIPYVGSGMQASAIAMDKVKTKQIWQASGLPVLPQMLLHAGVCPADVVAQVGLPLAIKPALEGSSVGISKVCSEAEIMPAYEKARGYDRVIMAERWVEGDELTGAIIGDEVMPLIRIRMQTGFYDYEAKYVTGATAYECPCGLPAEQEAAIQTLMKSAAKAIGVKDWSRVDVMLDAAQQPWLLEINTIPGMTPTSLVPKAAKQAGMRFEDTVIKILKTSWESYHA